MFGSLSISQDHPPSCLLCADWQSFALERGETAVALYHQCLKMVQLYSQASLGLSGQWEVLGLRQVSLETMLQVLQLDTLSLQNEDQVWSFILEWGRCAHSYVALTSFSMMC